MTEQCIITFTPHGTTVSVDAGTKVLSAAVKHKVPIRFGCGACRCGTCGIGVKGNGDLSPMAPNERELLERMNLSVDGQVRLACQARVLAGRVEVDLAFQNTYSPDEGDDF